MLSRWPIRNKLLLGLALLLVIVATLSWSGFHGLYAYRALIKDLERVAELPLATELNQRVSDLRVAALSASPSLPAVAAGPSGDSLASHFARVEFRQQLDAVGDSLGRYGDQLDRARKKNRTAGDRHHERKTVEAIRAALGDLEEASEPESWGTEEGKARLDAKLQQLQALVGELPSYLQDSMQQVPDQVRGEYRRRIVVAWITSTAAVVLLALFVRHSYRWVFRPLRLLIKGSRKVAAGNFRHRIQLRTHDEIAELARAMNDMTSRFQSIRDDLDRQVQQRTRQVVRAEQLAGVGFLAAGVAHEINSPLAAIVGCAESLERHLADATVDAETRREAMLAALQRTQQEAFRCKEITSNLLEFSRLGDAARKPCNLRELVQGVVELVGHVGRYREKTLLLHDGEPLAAPVNVQQLRQVVLNLVSFGLDNVAPGGCVHLELRASGDWAELTVHGHGGLSARELQRVFEPRARGEGSGTGLGLAISARIVEDHGGEIHAASDGPRRGWCFCVRLPLQPPGANAPTTTHEEHDHHYQAA